MIGLSGLITPSLEEMAHVAREMERAGLQAAAADRRRHHLARAHGGEDRAELLRPGGLRAGRLARVSACAEPALADSARRLRGRGARRLREGARAARAKKGPGPLHADRRGARNAAADRLERRTRRRAPRKLGRHACCDDYPLAELVDYIDWAPFFQAWELAGTYPDILAGPGRRRAARKFFAEAQAMLDRIVREGAGSRASGVFGLWPANAVTATTSRSTPTRSARDVLDDLAQPAPAEPEARRASPTSAWPTSSRRRRAASPTASAPSRSPPGWASRRGSSEFEAKHDDYSAIMLKALADRLAEAFAEHLHQRVRREFWGYAPTRALEQRGADRREVPRHPARRRAIPPAPTTPRRRTLFRLLDAEQQRRHARSPSRSRCCPPPR